MRIFRVSNRWHNSIARFNRFNSDSNGWSITVLPMGEPIAESLNPCLSSSDLNSRTWRSVSASTLVLWIDRNSMCRTPQDFRTSTCTCGSGSISSAKALRVNMVGPGRTNHRVTENTDEETQRKHIVKNQNDLLHFSVRFIS